MPLKLSGYALSYPQLNKLLESSPIAPDSDLTHDDMDIFTQWGPIVWLNRWLEKQGMGKKLQAVPLYDPVAASMAPVGTFPTDNVPGTQSPGGRISAEIGEGEGGADASGTQASSSKEGPTAQEDIDWGGISGQSLLLVRKCVFEEHPNSGQRTPVKKTGGVVPTSTTATSPCNSGAAVLQEASLEEPVEVNVQDTVESSTGAVCPNGDVNCSCGSQSEVTSRAPTSHLHHRHQHEKVGQASPLPGPQIPWLGPVVKQSGTDGQSHMPTEVEATPAGQPAPQVPPRRPSDLARMIDDINEELAIRRWIARNILGDVTGDATKVEYVTIENPYFEEI